MFEHWDTSWQCPHVSLHFKPYDPLSQAIIIQALWMKQLLKFIYYHSFTTFCLHSLTAYIHWSNILYFTSHRYTILFPFIFLKLTSLAEVSLKSGVASSQTRTIYTRALLDIKAVPTCSNAVRTKRSYVTFYQTKSLWIVLLTGNKQNSMVWINSL